jgi:hypothetical protein
MWSAGTARVRKTHLDVSLAVVRVEAGYRVLFITAAHLIATSPNAQRATHHAHAEAGLDDKPVVFTTAQTESHEDND